MVAAKHSGSYLWLKAKTDCRNASPRSAKMGISEPAIAEQPGRSHIQPLTRSRNRNAETSHRTPIARTEIKS